MSCRKARLLLETRAFCKLTVPFFSTTRLRSSILHDSYTYSDVEVQVDLVSMEQLVTALVKLDCRQMTRSLLSALKTLPNITTSHEAPGHWNATLYQDKMVIIEECGEDVLREGPLPLEDVRLLQADGAILEHHTLTQCRMRASRITPEVLTESILHDLYNILNPFIPQYHITHAYSGDTD
ncbi:hypothetical protein JTE90_026353 [Oedothorax gibbosus]|uniref:Uncharacterized protein n=1 Tax=Oedothorax gibbosus TaxID=931172 RepID=A0AAV6UJX6_9ARAC|nr:hypothetical protein JTE90_026353 [Oedothorax gibbosus]